MPKMNFPSTYQFRRRVLRFVIGCSIATLILISKSAEAQPRALASVFIDRKDGQNSEVISARECWLLVPVTTVPVNRGFVILPGALHCWRRLPQLATFNF